MCAIALALRLVCKVIYALDYSSLYSHRETHTEDIHISPIVSVAILKEVVILKNILTLLFFLKIWRLSKRTHIFRDSAGAKWHKSLKRRINVYERLHRMSSLNSKLLQVHVIAFF